MYEDLQLALARDRQRELLARADARRRSAAAAGVSRAGAPGPLARWAGDVRDLLDRRRLARRLRLDAAALHEAECAAPTPGTRQELMVLLPGGRYGAAATAVPASSTLPAPRSPIESSASRTATVDAAVAGGGPADAA